MSFNGEFRERLLHKQNEVLAHLNLRNQREYLLLINLVSRYSEKAKERAAETAPAAVEKTD